MVDFGFKTLFGTQRNINLLRRLLETVFKCSIPDIRFINIEHQGDSEEDRKAYFDVACRSDDGHQFIVEVQLKKQEFFPERAVYYSTFPITAQAPTGRWNYSFQPVYFLGLINFDMRHLDPSRADPSQFVHYFSILDEHTHECMTDRLRFVFVEVGRFNKPLEECDSFEDQLLYVMKNLPTFASRPKGLDDSYFDEFFEAATFASLPAEDKKSYRKTMGTVNDYLNTIDYARQEGREEGRAEGRVEGREEGQRLALEATARRMLADHVPMETIAKYSGLSEEQIKAL